MQEKRQSTRYVSGVGAKAGIDGITECGLRDLSITGCCLESERKVSLELNHQYAVTIKPEAESNIGQFVLLTESRWMKPKDGGGFEIGFMVLEAPSGKLFQNYVDYLAWRSQ
jgi:hypothetical protein